MNAASEAECFRDGKVSMRITVGVTGHRTLADEEAIAGRVREILSTRLREAFAPAAWTLLAGTAGATVPLTLVTALAEGADQLVASVALEFPETSMEGVLPFAEEQYLKTFNHRLSRKTFADLKAQAHRWTVLDRDQGRDDVALRPEGYEVAGKYVVGKSDLLIAVWDGKPARGKGGTAEIIDRAREKGIPLFVISSQHPYAVTLENQGGPALKSLEEIENFNLAPLQQGMIGLRIEEDYKMLYHNEAAGAIDSRLQDVVRERLLPVYARASILAEGYQRSYRHIGQGAYTLAAVSVGLMACGVVWERVHAFSLVAFAFELGLLLVLLYILHRREKNQVQKKWLENRALAERLRVAFFFISCGLPPRTSSRPYRGTTAYTLEEITEGIGAGEWVSRCYDAVVYSLPPLPDTSTAPQAPFLAYMRDNWIGGQKDYHLKKSDAAFRSNKRLRRWSKICVFCAAVVSAIHLGHLLRAPLGHAQSFSFEALSVIAILLPVAGAAIAGYRMLMEYPRISSSSNVMYGDLQRLAQEVNDLTAQEQLKQEQLRRLLLDTEMLMLRESQNWVNVMRFAELDPP